MARKPEHWKPTRSISQKLTFNGQSDGELFYKTKIGRGEMPKYEGKIGDDDIWFMVNFMRSLKK